MFIKQIWEIFSHGFIKRYILLPHFISCRSGTPISCLLNHRYFPTSHKGSVNFSFKIFFFLHSSDWMIYTDLSSGLLKISFANPHKSWNLCSEYLTSDVVLFCSKMYICLFNKVLIYLLRIPLVPLWLLLPLIFYTFFLRVDLICLPANKTPVTQHLFLFFFFLNYPSPVSS